MVDFAAMQRQHEDYTIRRACQDTPEDRPRNIRLELWWEWRAQNRLRGWRYVRRGDRDERD